MTDQDPLQNRIDELKSLDDALELDEVDQLSRLQQAALAKLNKVEEQLVDVPESIAVTLHEAIGDLRRRIYLIQVGPGGGRYAGGSDKLDMRMMEVLAGKTDELSEMFEEEGGRKLAEEIADSINKGPENQRKTRSFHKLAFDLGDFDDSIFTQTNFAGDAIRNARTKLQIYAALYGQEAAGDVLSAAVEKIDPQVFSDRDLLFALLSSKEGGTQ